MIRIDALAIDKSLPVPVGQQLYGLMSCALCFDALPRGIKLPSVRQLAEDLGVAPMTVTQVYQQLRDAGLVEIRTGLGAFTLREARPDDGAGAQMAALRAEIAALVARAERLGVTAPDLAAMVAAFAQGAEARVGLRLVFVGLFEGPSRAYVADLRPALGRRDRLGLVLFGQVETDPAARAAVAEADLAITFINRAAALQAMVPGARIATVPFVPAQATRQALAGLDPRATVAAVAYFADYVAVMRPSVREFAPHVAAVQVGWLGAPDLDAVLGTADAVVYASGADAVADRVRPGIPCFEFRHAPDPAAVASQLMPELAALRRARLAEADPAETTPRLRAARAAP